MTDIALIIIFFMVGIACGLLGYAHFSKTDHSFQLKEKIRKLDIEKAQQEEDIQEHLESTYQQIKMLNQQINALNKSWNQSIGPLRHIAKINEFPTAQSSVSHDAPSFTNAPKDFPQNVQDSLILHTPEQQATNTKNPTNNQSERKEAITENIS